MRSATIAIVDDDSRVLESLANLLQSAGYKVCPFHTSHAVLEQSVLMQVDCVISDVCMPAIDGLELERQASAVRPELPFILISARADSQVGAAKGRYRRFFAKPFDSDALLNAVAVAVGD